MLAHVSGFERLTARQGWYLGCPRHPLRREFGVDLLDPAACLGRGGVLMSTRFAIGHTATDGPEASYE